MSKNNLIISLVLLLFLSINIFAQDSPQTQSPDNGEAIKIDSQLVVVDVSVLDKNRNFVPGLTNKDFKVYDEQKEQTVELFKNERVPVSFGLLVDTSGSMRFKIKSVVAAAKELLKLCRPDDEIFIMDMKDTLHIKLAQPFTNNFEQVSKALEDLFTGGGTALLDGIAQAVDYAKEKGNNRRRAVVVMSDGDERESQLKVDQLITKLRQAEVQVYLMGFPDGFVTSADKFIDVTPNKSKNLLKKIAEESGGQAFFPQALSEVTPITTKINEELRAQYIIGYAPNTPPDGRWHRLLVKLADKKKSYTVRTRTGYYSK